MTGLTATGRLVRLALRRDRAILPAWLGSLGALTAGLVASVSGLYDSEVERVAAASFAAASPIARVFDGPASGTEIGAMTMVEAYGVLAILIALMSSQTVVRHTRQDEETGRAELLGSAVVGRHARLTAALVVAFGANLALAVIVALVLLGNGLAVTGSLTAAAAAAGVGWVFAGVAAVTAQVSATARGANSTAGAVIGIAFVLRAVGDGLGHVADSQVEAISAWPSWLSPIGWGQQVRAFHQDNLGPLLLLLVLTAVLVAVAFQLTRHRDVGAGMVELRPGPARASARLGTPLGLAWRLQRGILLAWTVGLVVLGATFGAVGESAEEILTISDQIEQALLAMAPEGGLVDLFFAFVTGFLGIAATGYTVQALLRMRAEEATGRLEPVLATAVGRARWLASHVAIAVGGTTALLAVTGLAGGVVYGAMTGRWAAGIGGLVGGALVQAPAALALGGFVLAVFGLLPRYAVALAWSALAVSLVMGQLGELLGLPQQVLNLSPFTHLPSVPAASATVPPLAALLAIAVLCGAVGVAAFRRRDLAIAA